MGKTSFLLLFLLLFSYFTHAQSTFQKGFILLLNNDTVFGQLEKRSNDLNFRSCKFKSGNAVAEYTVHEINGFAYENGKCFSSGIVEGEFVEVLVKGFMKLYKYKSVFYIKKGDERPIKLESVTKERNIDDENFFIPDRKWEGKLSYALYDGFPNSTRIVSNLRLNDEDLTKIIIKYNQKKDTHYIEYKSNKPWAKNEFGAIIGLEETFLQNSDIQHRYTYIKPHYSSWSPTMGLTWEMTSPRFSERFSFQPEILFSRVNYDGMIHKTTIPETYYDVHFNWGCLSVPINLKYSYPIGKSILTFQAGIMGDFILNANTSLLQEDIVGNIVYTYPKTEAFEVEEFVFGICGGIGFQRTFNHYQAGLAFRISRMSDVAQGRFLIMEPQRCSLSFQLSTK